jgi:hypothetical protein
LWDENVLYRNVSFVEYIGRRSTILPSYKWFNILPCVHTSTSLNHFSLHQTEKVSHLPEYMMIFFNSLASENIGHTL